MHVVDLHLRLPQPLNLTLDAEARKRGKSKNVVIHTLLAEALTPSATGPEVLAHLAHLEAALAALTTQVHQIAQAVAHLQATADDTLAVVSAIDRRQGIAAAKHQPHHRR